MKIEKKLFGKLPSGEPVDLYTIHTDSGLVAEVTNYGAIVTKLIVPDKNGKPTDVVLGFDTLEPYLGDHPYFGCAVGRFCNRIGKGRFSIDGKTYQITQNERQNTLHGGKNGFHRVLWKAEEIKEEASFGIKFFYRGFDGEEGFPGNLNVEMKYLFTNNNEFKIKYTATTDKPTHINFTNHSYFNLNGCQRNVCDEILSVDADRYTESDNELIPTGRILPVDGTALDLRKPVNVGEQIHKIGGVGFDHNFVLNKKDKELKLAAVLFDPITAIVLETYTTEPAVQVYSGYHLKDVIGKNGKIYQQFYGLCLETQHYPDSPNHENFPSTLLKTGEVFASETVYKFGIKK